jgi:hypothetical protein
MDITELVEAGKVFENNVDMKKAVEKAWQQHTEFLKRYPFREHPENIELLTPDKIYNPGAEDYFFKWIEHKTKELGHLTIYGANVWANARNQLETLKSLLRLAVDDDKGLSEKVDAHWEDIKGFGGDKHIAKKVIFCYYPKEVVPIFNTAHLEHFANELGIDFRREALETYGKSYDVLSVGQTFALFNGIFLILKHEHEEFKRWDNTFFGRLLYDTLPPQKMSPPGTREAKPLHSIGILFEPEYEQEVVYLFSVFHRDLGFPYIIKIRNEFPDAVVMTKDKEPKKVEFEVHASDFLVHGHDKKGCDYIVCWENDLEEDDAKNLPEIIAIKDNIEEFM